LPESPQAAKKVARPMQRVMRYLLGMEGSRNEQA
jgi:hypothetical protein